MMLTALALALPTPADAQNSLRFFKNYFVTGDYAVAGVGLRGQGAGGFAQGTINLSTVPAGADVIAAFLYWQTVELTANPSSINGFFRSKAIVGKALGDPRNAACWSSGGTTGPSGSSGRVYRADVLRYLPIDSTRNVRVANGAHVVRLPDSGGNGNGNISFTNGATLVVVYRIVVPGNPAAAPLRSVVIYDGAYTSAKRSDDLNQTLGGFYQAASNPAARLTSIVGNGQPTYRASLAINGSTFFRLFTGGQGPRWDNPTLTFPLSSGASSFRVQAAADDTNLCLTWGAIVTSMNVADSDADGLLDTWETNGMHLNPGTATSSATFAGCAQYPSEPCVDLPRMGALPGQKDIFVEADWMTGENNPKPGPHSHIPKLAALTPLIAAFKQRNIRLHFDVGSNYQNLATAPDFAIVPSSLAQGGEVIPEANLTCPNARTPISACAYTTPYPALSFKKGFTSVRDGNFALGLPSRFSPLRRDLFHYALFAHAFAGPFDSTTGRPTTTEPRAVSGVADRPGGDLMVTLGLWSSNLQENDQVGSSLVQAGTLMHELGHNLGLSHAGALRVPNCMPNYPSVMNYLYQSRGLSPLSGGDKTIDFSSGSLASVNENSLLESWTSPVFKTRFYGPLTTNDPPSAAAALRCDGSPIADGARMLRAENDFSNFTDWDRNGVSTNGLLRLDVNFSGLFGDGVNGGAFFADSNDWSNLNLQQIGGRLNVNGLSTDVGVSDLGVSDLGVSDLGALELGALELGVSDLGVSDLGVSDLGALELGDIDYETAVLSSIDPPPAPSPSCPNCGLRATVAFDRITLNWTAPDTGSVLNYNLYRSTSGLPGSFTFLKSAPGGAAAATTDDAPNGSTTQFNTNYTYYVTSLVNVRGIIVESLPSNLVSGIVKRIFVAGRTLSAPFNTAIPTPLFDAAGLDLPLPASVTCTTAATQGSNAGNYPIVCSGPATINGTNGIAYTNGSITITPIAQTINGFAALAPRTFGDAAFSIGGVTATSGLTVTFSTVGPCSVSGPLVTIAGAGNCAVTAQQPGNVNYLLAPPVTQSFTIAKRSQAIAFGTLLAVTFGGPALSLTAAADSGLAVSYLASGNCSVAGSLVTYGNAGTCNLTARQVGDNNYLPALDVLQILTINRASQSITLLAPAAKTFGDAAFTVSATATSLQPVTFGVQGNCTISGALVQITGAGTCAVTASQGGNTNYLPAPDQSQLISIAKAPATVTFSATLGNTLYNTTPFPLTASANSGTTVNLTPSGACAASAGAYVLINVGTCTFTAQAAETPNYTAASVTQSFLVGQAPQNITFGPLTAKTVGDAPFTISASASSGIPVTFSTSSTSCSVAAGAIPGTATVTLTSAGSCAITASQGGNSLYLPATPVTQTFTILPLIFNFANFVSTTGLTLNGTATNAGTGGALRLTSSAGQGASSWFSQPVPVSNSFSTTFQFKITPVTNPPADGLVFVIQTGDVNALGGGGGQIGYHGIPGSVAVEFDTYLNNPDFGDINANHVAIQSNGTLPNSSDHRTAANKGINNAPGFNIADGLPHTVTITYAAGILSVQLDTLPTILSVPFDIGTLGLLPGGLARVGFTGSTGANSQTTDLLNWSWQSN